jgi:hypothetical protein
MFPFSVNFLFFRVGSTVTYKHNLICQCIYVAVSFSCVGITFQSYSFPLRTLQLEHGPVKYLKKGNVLPVLN